MQILRILGWKFLQKYDFVVVYIENAPKSGNPVLRCCTIKKVSTCFLKKNS
jgi:hypothetical protein